MSDADSVILVVDDNEQNRALARETLEDEGFQVFCAVSGSEAIRAVETAAPDCVLLDIRMPGMDGFATCRAIRDTPAGKGLPIVFLTAARDLETFEKAAEAGGDDFLTKPVQPGELVLRVRAALKLRRMGAELRTHYELVRRQRDDLMRLHLQKERLSAFIVHDLKNPINNMDLHAQLLLRNQGLPDRARDSAQRIRSEARALLRMVLNLLDVSRSEEGDLQPQRVPVDSSVLVADVLRDFADKADMASVTLVQTGDSAEVPADPDLLRRVIENLVDNAIRHAPKGSQIEVATACLNPGIEIGVMDSGAGIPPEMRERVFDRFVQAGDARLVSRAGRGLGLTFCKLAVEAHGGRIWITDDVPGTVFRLRLPG